MKTGPVTPFSSASRRQYELNRSFLKLTILVSVILAAILASQIFESPQNVLTITSLSAATGVGIILSLIIYKKMKTANALQKQQTAKIPTAEKLPAQLTSTAQETTQVVATIPRHEWLWDQSITVDPNLKLQLENLVHSLECDPCGANLSYMFYAPSLGIMAARSELGFYEPTLPETGTWYIGNATTHLQFCTNTSYLQSCDPPLRIGSPTPRDPGYRFGSSFFDPPIIRTLHSSDNLQNYKSVTVSFQDSSVVLVERTPPYGQTKYYINGQETILINYRKISRDAHKKIPTIKKCLMDARWADGPISHVVGYLYGTYVPS